MFVDFVSCVISFSCYISLFIVVICCCWCRIYFFVTSKWLCYLVPWCIEKILFSLERNVDVKPDGFGLFHMGRYALHHFNNGTGLLSGTNPYVDSAEIWWTSSAMFWSEQTFMPLEGVFPTFSHCLILGGKSPVKKLKQGNSWIKTKNKQSSPLEFRIFCC